jgi:hypothetical protein
MFVYMARGTFLRTGRTWVQLKNKLGKFRLLYYAVSDVVREKRFIWEKEGAIQGKLAVKQE